MNVCSLTLGIVQIFKLRICNCTVGKIVAANPLPICLASAFIFCLEINIWVWIFVNSLQFLEADGCGWKYWHSGINLMLIAPVNHIKAMLGKQNPQNHGESWCLIPKDLEKKQTTKQTKKKKRPSVRERIRRMKKKQKKALINQTACCNEWRSGTAGAASQQGHLTVSDISGIREHFSSSYLICM